MEKINNNLLLDANSVFKSVPIASEQKVADLGCGKFGYFTFPTAKMVGKKGVVYAVDVMKACLEEVERKSQVENFSQVKTIWSNLEIWQATKIESASLDTVLLVNTLYQSDKRSDILREAVRMLKKKGKVLIVEWENTDIPFGPEPEKRVKKQPLIDAAPKLGLELEKEFKAGKYHFGLVFIKI
ncbi:MAG: class I SAM-dependent methyltransferase [Candidatus Pacebacteria bacterium]|nr:class I SAM-dependent methyltransferase [Candidatus Paceibacterota bacterium]